MNTGASPEVQPKPGVAPTRQDQKTERALLAGVAALMLWSVIGCQDLFTWFLEVLPVLTGIPILILLYPRFRFTKLVYALIAFHMSILIVGGHYTYARVPAFDWIKDWLRLDRT